MNVAVILLLTPPSAASAASLSSGPSMLSLTPPLLPCCAPLNTPHGSCLPFLPCCPPSPASTTHRIMSSMKPMALAAREPRGPAEMVFTRTLYLRLQPREGGGTHGQKQGGEVVLTHMQLILLPYSRLRLHGAQRQHTQRINCRCRCNAAAWRTRAGQPPPVISDGKKGLLKGPKQRRKEEGPHPASHASTLVSLSSAALALLMPPP